MNNSAKSVTIKLLEELDIKILESAIKNSFDQHPFSESLTAICDVLKEWSIDNYVIQFNSDNYQEAFSLPTPFITFINKNDGEFIVIKKIQETVVEYHSSIDHSVKCSVKDFMDKWQGVTLIPFVENRENIDTRAEHQKTIFTKNNQIQT